MNRGNQFASRKQVNEIVALGRQCARTAYPNPRREGCPDASKLRAIAYRDRRYNLADLPISHVVTCSPCFRQYLRFRYRLILLTTAQVATACVVLVAAILVSARFLRDHTTTAVPPAITQNEHRPGGAQPAETTERRNPPFALQVSLSAFSPVRGDDSKSSPTKIHLPAKSLRITFLLPFGMEPRAYTIRVLNSDGKEILQQAVVARLQDGLASFDVELDLEKATAGTELTLLIREPGLSWRRYPMVVD